MRISGCLMEKLGASRSSGYANWQLESQIPSVRIKSPKTDSGESTRQSWEIAGKKKQKPGPNGGFSK